ncbi:hypothetical protein [Gymnodinialimonas sp.]
MPEVKALEAKTVIDVARGFTAVLLALAAVFMSAAAFLHQQAGTELLQMIFLALTTLHMLLAARMIDWILDKITAEVWMAVPSVGKTIEPISFRSEFQRWDGAYFRMKMFGGAYFAFVTVTTLIGVSTLYLAIFRAQQLGVLPSISQYLGAQTSLKFFLCFMLGLYLPYQMLTIRSHFARPVFVCGVILIIAFFSKSVATSYFDLRF